MFSQLDLLFSTTPLSGPEQMALDEVLLGSVDKPLCRIYKWKGPCVTFGYFQKISEVRPLFPTHELIRRWTGGGIVEHGHDVTFSLIVPQKWGSMIDTKEKIRSEIFIDHRTLPPFLRPALFYETLHKAMASALQAHQITARLATGDDLVQGEACFVAPALHDLLVKERKILGGAQRRSAGSLLYQGSLLLSNQPTIVDNSFIQSIFHSLASNLASTVTIIEEQPSWLEQATEVAMSRYTSTDWLERR
ncbi:MAG: lipoyl protein ligase domain-containing protein [Chthoniobacterales bacterium]